MWVASTLEFGFARTSSHCSRSAFFLHVCCVGTEPVSGGLHAELILFHAFHVCGRCRPSPLRSLCALVFSPNPTTKSPQELDAKARQLWEYFSTDNISRIRARCISSVKFVARAWNPCYVLAGYEDVSCSLDT